MDTSAEELGRIVAFVNRRPWIMEDPTSYDSSSSSDSEKGATTTTHNDTNNNSNYFLDRLGTSDTGDSSLHRVCAWHTTPDQFQTFLDHMKAHHEEEQQQQQQHSLVETTAMETTETAESSSDMVLELEGTPLTVGGSGCYESMPPPPRLDQTNNQGVSALHIAVYRNAFHVQSMVRMLLKEQPSLASQQMTCGSTPLHIVCAHNITIRKDVLLALLQADPSAVCKEDVNGDTPLSLLWKNVLRFRWAQSDHIALADDDDEENGEESDNSNNDWNSANGIHRRRQRPRPSWMTVISPDQYVDFSLRMVRAALGKTNIDDDYLTLADICCMPRCPPLLVRLVLQHYTKLAEPCKLASPSTLFGAPNHSNGMTPLHYAAQQTAATQQFVPAHVLTKTQSVVDCLLDHFPCMVFAQDHGGRLALHYALEKNVGGCHSSGTQMQELKSFYTSLYRFVKTNPDSLRMIDPATGLYPFALLAASTRGYSSSGICVSDEKQCSEMEMDIDYEPPIEQDLVHLGATFRLLRRFPEAALYRA